jgi:tetratricopeptide (TPR) repeat protein
VYAETWFPRLQYGWSDLRSGIRGPWHYIDGPDPELFDVVADPAERDNRLASRGAPEAIVQALQEIGDGRTSRAEVGEEELRQLASLGYVGGAGDVPDTGIDPKRVVRDAELLWGFVEDGPAADPGDEAVLRAARTIGPGNTYLHAEVVRTLLARGRVGAAAEVLRPFDATDDATLQALLGQVALATGRPEQAAARFDRVLAVDGGHAGALLGKGLVDLEDGRVADAESWIRRALAAEDGLAEAWNALAVTRLEAGRPDEAIDALERAVDRDPDLADAWFNLAMLRGRSGDVDEAVAALRRYVPLVAGDERERALAMLREIEAGR